MESNSVRNIYFRSHYIDLKMEVFIILYEGFTITCQRTEERPKNWLKSASSNLKCFLMQKTFNLIMNGVEIEPKKGCL